jgi:hypothetical protein
MRIDKLKLFKFKFFNIFNGNIKFFHRMKGQIFQNFLQFYETKNKKI